MSLQLITRTSPGNRSQQVRAQVPERLLLVRRDTSAERAVLPGGTSSAISAGTCESVSRLISVLTGIEPADEQEAPPMTRQG